MINTIFYILIAGKRCSGKDTLADLLKRNAFLGDLMDIRGFAKSLKYNYAKILSSDLSESYDTIYEKLLNDYQFKQTHRPGLIQYGVSEKEKYGEDIWVQRLIESGKDSKMVIIPDVRYRYELFHEVFTNENSIKIKINCSDEKRSNRGWKYTEGIDNNHSECDLDNIDIKSYDHIIENNSDISYLENEANNIINKYCL